MGRKFSIEEFMTVRRLRKSIGSIEKSVEI